MQNMSFSYKKVLIIGATSGIGLSLAEKIIANGSHVIAVGRRRENLDSLVRHHGPEKVSTFQFDITDLGGIPSFVESYVSGCTLPIPCPIFSKNRILLKLKLHTVF
jgi:NADP-dependent 3-hydroxy acid dehydrogenase YdfG